MGVEDGVHPRHPARQQLLRSSGAVSTSRRMPAVALDDDAGPGAAVARLGRVAGAPVAAAVLAADQRHAGGAARAEQDHPHRAQAALRNRRRKFAVVRSASASGSRPRTSASTLRGVGDIGRLVALAAERHRREVRRVGLHQQPIRWKIAGDLPQFSGFREGQDAGEADIAAHRDRRLGQRPRRAEAVQQEAELAAAITFILQDSGDVVRRRRGHGWRAAGRPAGRRGYGRGSRPAARRAATGRRSSRGRIRRCR